MSDTTPDATTGLSPRDKALIVATWEKVCHPDNKEANAVELLIQLLQTYPELQVHFKRYKDAKLDELRSNPTFRRHGMSVIGGITGYVDNLDNTPTLVSSVHEMAQVHVKKHGVGFEGMEKLRNMFAPYLRSILGKECTPEIETAWSRLLTVHNKLFKQTEDEIRASGGC